ncbi:hypothetical protein [Pleurocapsa sp. CCALA 161]|nr:hypothetical protein [Pleurocapsa sp. CCALA 161]
MQDKLQMLRQLCQKICNAIAITEVMKVKAQPQGLNISKSRFLRSFGKN